MPPGMIHINIFYTTVHGTVDFYEPINYPKAEFSTVDRRSWLYLIWGTVSASAYPSFDLLTICLKLCFGDLNAIQ
jgi:hypothetical protein